MKDTLGTVDFINGFIEDYDDPLGRKATWEGYVNIKDSAASARTEILSANAQWFEDHSPVDPRFRKKEVRGISAKVVNAVTLAGALGMCVVPYLIPDGIKILLAAALVRRLWPAMSKELIPA